MKFEDASVVESLCWEFKQSDYVRGLNRAAIQDLFNGVPPWSDEEAESNGISINYNDLASTRIGHDARTQFNGAFLKPGNYFRSTTDMGPVHKRQLYGSIVTRHMQRIMKRSLPYFEKFRSQFALDVLHGVGPAVWADQDCWCPDALGMEDVFIPAKTYLTMANLPFFATYRSFTAPELIKLTSGPNVDPGWDRELVEACIRYVDKESMTLYGSNWPEVWSPEKVAERVKSDGGFYATDQAPTIDVFDFKFWEDDGKQSGWRRRIILDAWSTSNASVAPHSPNRADKTRRDGEPYSAENSRKFLYSSGDKVYAQRREQMIAFQFADLSAKAPFEYHSVRSLGFLVYASCQLQNRLRCRFYESVFEQLMMYFRSKSGDDVERILKVELFNRGFVDKDLEFLGPAERYQINTQLAELAMNQLKEQISENSSSYTKQLPQDRTERTKFEVMAREQNATALTSSALTQAYFYQRFEYAETARRFFNPHSSDPEVREFRAGCITEGVPEKILVAEAWEHEPERVMGAGNKTLEMAIAQQLLEMRNLYDPEAQRSILRDVTLAVTDDPARAQQLVPEQPHISDSVHDAQLAAGTLLMGLPVAIKSGLNRIEYVETLLQSLALSVAKVAHRGGVAKDADELVGLNNLAQHIAQNIKLVGQDKQEKERAKKYADELGKLMNAVKQFQQAFQKQQQAQAEAQQQSNGGLDPKDRAKIQATMLTAQAKVAQGKQSHAAKTAQRQIAFEKKLQQDQQKHALEMSKEVQRAQLDAATTDIKTAAEVRATKMRSMNSAKKKDE